MSTPPKRKGRETPAERAKRRKVEKLAQWKLDHPDETPYEDYQIYAPRLTERVIAAIGDRPLPTYSVGPKMKGGPARKRTLTVEKIAIALYAVHKVGGGGLTYGQLSKCFQRVIGVGSGNNQSSALLSSLLDLGLIMHIAKYAVGKRGNRYRPTHNDKFSPNSKLPRNPKPFHEPKTPPTYDPDDWTL